MKIKIFATLITLVCAVIFLTGNASAAFVANESGISAYVKAGPSINLDQAAAAYRIVEDRTSSYIIGTVDVPNSTEYELPHVFTSADGWIMAYYPKEEPRAMIMQWGQYDKNNPDLSQMNSTRLEDAISKVSNAIGIDYTTLKPNTKYYDFQYPEANGLTLIAETRNTEGADSFKFRVPNEYTLYDTSWAYFTYDASTYGVTQFIFDGNLLIGTDGGFSHNSRSDGGNLLEERYYGIINSLTKDVLHKGDLNYYSYGSRYGGGDRGSSNIAIALITKQP